MTGKNKKQTKTERFQVTRLSSREESEDNKMIDCGDSVGWRLEALFTALQAFNHNEPDKKYRQMVENMSCSAELWWNKDSDNDEDSVGLPILSPVTN